MVHGWWFDFKLTLLVYKAQLSYGGTSGKKITGEKKCCLSILQVLKCCLISTPCVFVRKYLICCHYPAQSVTRVCVLLSFHAFFLMMQVLAKMANSFCLLTIGVEKLEVGERSEKSGLFCDLQGRKETINNPVLFNEEAQALQET